MATSSENTGSDIDATGAMNCDFCTMKPAEGYCTDCLEYLCDECFRNHCKPKPCRNHKLVGKDKMPRRQVSTAVVDNKCDCNANNNVNFYCEEHHKLLCVNCIVNIHKGCRFRDLTERSTHTEKSEEYSEFLKELDESENKFELNKSLSQQHKDRCNESFKQVFQDIDIMKQLLQEKKDAVDNLEKEALETREKYVRKMQDIEELNSKAADNVRSKRKDLTTLQDMAQSEKLFVALHRSKSLMKQLKQDMAQTNVGNIPQTYTFLTNDVIKNMLTNVAKVGELVQIEKSSSSRIVDRNCTPEYPEYGLPKCIALSENNIAVIDYIHNTLQKVNDGDTVAEIKLSSGPWDIARISSTSVVVTQPGEEKVSIIILRNRSVHIDKEIQVYCRCEGIAYADGKLFIVSSKPACLVIYDTAQSKEENRITTGENGRALFIQPAYIDVHPQKHLICLSDRKSNKVFLLNWEGALSNVFECDSMKMPLAVAFQDDTVIAVGFESNTINVISYETQRGRKIESRFLNNLEVDRFFNDSTFKKNACWQYCAGKYFAIACKSSV